MREARERVDSIAGDKTAPQQPSATFDQPTNVQSHASNTSWRSDAGDVDMDSDDQMEPPASEDDSPRQTSPWALRPSPVRAAYRPFNTSPSSRVPTPIVTTGLIRPKPSPVQTRQFGGSSTTLRSDASSSVPRSDMSMLADRLPSPVDEDEPHTPTTAAGSQLSLLTVSDMDVDSQTPEPLDTDVGDAVMVVRKQRQRSGAFISTPDSARKFSMGYRDDCERCRMRVPGHVNHFLGR